MTPKDKTQVSRQSEIGKKGEVLAAEFLQELGFIILERNWRYKKAEVDIIAKDGKVLVFTEVKSRSSTHFGRPEDFVDDKKKKMMTAAISYYMEAHQHNWEIRFDIISVIFDSEKQYRLQHFKDAFFPGL